MERTPKGYRIETNGLTYGMRPSGQEVSIGFASTIELELWALVQAQERENATLKDQKDAARDEYEKLQLRLAGLISAAKAAAIRLHGAGFHGPERDLRAAIAEAEK